MSAGAGDRAALAAVAACGGEAQERDVPVTDPRTAVQPQRGRRLEPDARREQLLSCAVRLFGERPYDAVSTTDIAREAGIARGLLNHYFGTKRDLYLAVVRRMVLLPEIEGEPEIVVTGSVRRRVERAVDWFLDTVGRHGSTFLAVVGGSGIGDDPELAAILATADDVAAGRVLQLVGMTAGEQAQRAAVRAYGGLAKAAVREWEAGALSRGDAHLLLSEALLAIVQNVLPQVGRES
ncbi:MAG: acrR [Frankiales bacterium]|nr:acrR [Frankiales bacterium]